MYSLGNLRSYLSKIKLVRHKSRVDEIDAINWSYGHYVFAREKSYGNVMKPDRIRSVESSIRRRDNSFRVK